MNKKQLKALDIAFLGIGVLLLFPLLILSKNIETSLFALGIIFIFLSFSITDYRLTGRLKIGC